MTGTAKTDLETITITDGQFDGRTFTWKMRLTEPFRMSMSGEVVVDGDSFAGGVGGMLGKSDMNGDGVVDTDLNGPNIAPDRVLLAADWTRGAWTARLQHQVYVARSFTGIGVDPRNDFEGYELTDAFVRRSFGFGSVSLAVSNLFDADYVSYISDTERPTDDLRFFAGRGRALTVALERRF